MIRSPQFDATIKYQKYFTFYYRKLKPSNSIITVDMLTPYLAEEITTTTLDSKSYGKIKPIKFNYYSNPQPCMFTFTLLLTITLSMLMVNWVFIGFYHKIVGSLLCLYIVYRFLSLGLSNPGLAVQTAQQIFSHQMKTNSFMMKDHNILSQHQYHQHQHQMQQTQQNQQIHNSIQQTINLKQHQFLSMRENFSKIGFFHFCSLCQIPTQKQTRHCKTCRTCIDGFDHHCIWIGKCIGKKNMWQFKQFLCFVFVTLIYALILSIQSSRIQKIS